MRLSFGIVMACLAAGLSAPALWSQPALGRLPADLVQIGGSSYLGIGVADITAERAKALGLKEERGAEVTTVAVDGPASKAGIKQGDVVLEYDGTAVEGIAQLTRLVRETPVGRQVTISVWQSGAAQTLTVSIAARKGTVIPYPGNASIFSLARDRDTGVRDDLAESGAGNRGRIAARAGGIRGVFRRERGRAGEAGAQEFARRESRHKGR